MKTKDERNVALLQAYRMAVETNQDGIADKLEGVILASMGVGGGDVVFRDGRSVTPATVPFGSMYKVTCSGIDGGFEQTTTGGAA